MSKSKIKAVPMSELSPLIEAFVSEGTDVTLTVTGNSMKPMLTHLRDSVVLTKCDPMSLKKGDIPLYCREDGSYILHRILKVGENTYDISGDHQWVLEKGVPKSAVICKVKGFTRKGKYRSCNNIGYRLYAFLWRIAFPLRRIIMATHGRLHRLLYRTPKST